MESLEKQLTTHKTVAEQVSCLSSTAPGLYALALKKMRKDEEYAALMKEWLNSKDSYEDFTNYAVYYLEVHFYAMR